MIFGLPDGGAGITFVDAPSHHNPDGTITVTVAPSTLEMMVRLAEESMAADRIIKATRDDEADGDVPFTYIPEDPEDRAQRYWETN